MSLIKCQECEKEISDKADKCPNCGCPIPKVNEGIREKTNDYVKTETKKSKWSTAKLVIGIISMFLFIIITFQSCAAGLSNAIENSDEASGSFGMIVAILITISGIISVSTSKSIKKGGSIWCTSLYYTCAFVSFVGAGRYTDLKLWGFISFCFGFTHLLSILSNKKNKIIGCICSAVFLLFLFASGGASGTDSEKEKAVDSIVSEVNTEKESESKSETNKNTEVSEPSDSDDNTINFVSDKISIVYTGFEIAKDYEENDCIVVYFDYTNNSGENASAVVSSYIQVFQDGIECESAILSFNTDIEATENYSKDIQSGNTANVARTFKIKSDGDITIEASEAFSFDNTKDTMILEIKQ